MFPYSGLIFLYVHGINDFATSAWTQNFHLLKEHTLCYMVWVTVKWMGELGKGCVEGGGCGELLDSHHRVDRETNSGKYQQKI